MRPFHTDLAVTHLGKLSWTFITCAAKKIKTRWSAFNWSLNCFVLDILISKPCGVSRSIPVAIYPRQWCVTVPSGGEMVSCSYPNAWFNLFSQREPDNTKQLVLRFSLSRGEWRKFSTVSCYFWFFSGVIPTYTLVKFYKLGYTMRLGFSSYYLNG